MKKIKNILIIILGAIILMSDSIPMWAQQLSETDAIDAVGEDYITSGDWQYQLKKEDGVYYAYLNRYLGSEVNLEIPSELDGYTVKGIPLTVLFLNNYTLETVSLPDTINSIAAGAFASAYALKSITVNQSSAIGFRSIDGVLYCGDKLIAYPPAKEGESYSILNGTTEVFRGAFYGCLNLRKITVPNSVITIGNSAFTRSTNPIDIFVKRETFQASYIDGKCWQMALGTKFIVKSEDLKNQVVSNLQNTEGYKDSTDKIAVEVAEAVPATSLTFTDGSTEKHVLIDYADGADNTYYLHSLYTQAPADTTENVSWSVLSGGEYCKVSSGGTLVTTSGGEAVLQGTDESGHTLTLHVSVYSPMESCDLYGYNYIKNPSVDIGSDEEDEWNTVFAVIKPYTSYAWNKEIMWESLNPDIATVESTGTRVAKVKGIYPGIATLKATINNDGKLIEKTIEVSVKDSITNCTIAPIPDQEYPGPGTQICPIPVVQYKGEVLTEGIDYEVEYVENDGIYPIGFADEYESCLLIKGIGNFEGKQEVSFKIVDFVQKAKVYIEDCTVDPIPPQTYLGQQICPKPVVRCGERIFQEGIDYTLSYGNNCNVGKSSESLGGSITIIGKDTTFKSRYGFPEYRIYVEFDIVDGRSEQQQNNSSTNEQTKQITGVKDSYTKAYGSKSFILKAKGPAAVTYASSNKKVITVKKTSGKVTIKGIGRATITIKSGKLTKKVIITINPKKLSSVKASASGKKAIRVSWKRDKLATGYQVQYATNSKFTKGKKTETIKKNKTISYTIKKLKSKKKYYVRIRAYKVVKGEMYYSDWSGVKIIKVK